jgi:uroporphyrinogen decarboxylase
MMNSRERVVAALSHQEPDRVPISLGGTAHKISDALFTALCQHFAIDCEPARVLTGISFTYYDDKLLGALGTDTRFVHMGAPEPYQKRVYDDGRYENEWGIVFQDEGHYQGVVGNPLRNASLDDLDRYAWPDVQDTGRVAGLQERARYLFEQTEYAIVAYRPTMAGLFETASMLRGMEQFMVDLMLDEPFANALLDKILALHLKLYELQLGAVGPYVQVVEALDDYGSQSGLMISPALYREMFLPRHRRLNALIRQLAPQAKIMFHSCGGVAPLIPDFIEAGFDVLNPLQPRAAGMNFPKMKAEFGETMSFLGGLDVQQTLRGPRAGVEQETMELIRMLAPGGGFVFAPSHNLSHDVPVKNVLCMLETVQRYGSYPITM